MKILQVNKHSWPYYGGIEKVVQDIMEFVVSDDVQIDLLCINDKPGQETKEFGNSKIFKAAKGIKILSMPISSSFFKMFRRLVPQYDCLLLHHPFPLAFFTYWLFARNKPVYVWYHSDIVRQKISGKLFNPLLKYVLKRSKRIIVSDNSIADSSSVLKPFAHKITAIPFAVDHSKYTELAKVKGQDLKSNYDKPLLLSVGRLIYYKGYEYLIDSMAEVPAHLLIIGNGPLKTDLEKRISQNQLTNVSIIDHVEDLVPYYFAADVFVLPSTEKSEAFGLVQMEAMIAGTPVINTQLPTAASRVSLHNVTGITVEPKNSDALKSAILTLLSDSALRERLGNAAKDRAAEHFSKDRFSAQVLELFKKYV